MYIVKVPGTNSLDNSEGCQKAGNAILNELKKIEVNEQGKLINFDNLELEEIHLDNKNLKLTNKLIYENAFKDFQEKPKIIFLGGDHFISYSLTRAFLDYCENEGKKPCLIVFDAHADCFSLKDSKEVNNRNWLRNLIEEGFPAENILLVGMRRYSKEEAQFLREKGIRIVSINQLRLDLEDSCDVLMEFSNGKELYVSLDIDVLDPAFAPATDLIEPGGLTSREIVYLFQRVSKIKLLKAVDIVEINIEKDKNYRDLTVKLGAKIVSELLS